MKTARVILLVGLAAALVACSRSAGVDVATPVAPSFSFQGHAIGDPKPAKDEDVAIPSVGGFKVSDGYLEYNEHGQFVGLNGTVDQIDAYPVRDLLIEKYGRPTRITANAPPHGGPQYEWDFKEGTLYFDTAMGDEFRGYLFFVDTAEALKHPANPSSKSDAL